MPYTNKDVRGFTKKARTAKQKRQWRHVYDTERARGLPEGRAIAAASGVIKRGGRRSRRNRRR